jgi:hypothetical protein
MIYEIHVTTYINQSFIFHIQSFDFMTEKGEERHTENMDMNF